MQRDLTGRVKFWQLSHSSSVSSPSLPSAFAELQPPTSKTGTLLTQDYLLSRGHKHLVRGRSCLHCRDNSLRLGNVKIEAAFAHSIQPCLCIAIVTNYTIALRCCWNRSSSRVKQTDDDRNPFSSFAEPGRCTVSKDEKASVF